MKETKEMQFPSLAWEDPWSRKWQATLVFSPGKFQGRSRLVGYSPWGCKESDMTERSTYHSNITLCVCVYMYMCVYVYMHVYICVYVYVYMYMYVCIYVCVYIYMYVCMCICIFIYVYVYVYVYMYKYHIFLSIHLPKDI